MKLKLNRRYLTRSGKVAFVSHTNEGKVFYGLVQGNARISVWYEDGRCGYHFFDEEIVASYKPKKKEKPLIVWTTAEHLQIVKDGHSGLIKQHGLSFEVPLRPLTKKERERWGV